MCLGVCTSVAVVKASERSLEEYYLPMLDGESELVRSTFMYAVDMVRVLVGFCLRRSWRFCNFCCFQTF